MASSDTMGPKVIIAGGSVAGLALANMLEQTGIDFVVLEKYSKIAPQLGASIAVMPNGARILDQLGCWDSLTNSLSADDMFQHISTRDDHGREVFAGTSFQKKLTDRSGYSFVFVDRQTLVQTLYDNLKDKSKVLVNQGVMRVNQSADEVTVVTTGGKTFVGTILVGADGVHSTVRKEMWRLANEDNPGSFARAEQEADNAPCKYSCIFGISHHIKGIDLKASYTVRGDNHSYLVSNGPGGKLYWFLFDKLDKISYGLYDRLPRYTDVQRDELAQKHLKDKIVDELGLTFGQLWENRTAATLTALPEYVLSQWHYGRVITVGDAVHKFNPISGQGGNSAFETCAALANVMHEHRESEACKRHFTSQDVSEIFKRVQVQRYDRALMLKNAGAVQQAMAAQETFVWRMFNRLMDLFAGGDLIVNLMWRNNKGATRLQMLAVPQRTRNAPFEDELPSSTGPAAILKRCIASIRG